MQPIIEKFAEKESEQNGCGNDETNLRVAREGDERILALGRLARFGHAGIVMQTCGFSGPAGERKRALFEAKTSTLVEGTKVDV